MKVRRKENISGSRVREERTKSDPEVEKLCELKFGNCFFFTLVSIINLSTEESAGTVHENFICK